MIGKRRSTSDQKGTQVREFSRLTIFKFLFYSSVCRIHWHFDTARRGTLEWRVCNNGWVNWAQAQGTNDRGSHTSCNMGISGSHEFSFSHVMMAYPMIPFIYFRLLFHPSPFLLALLRRRPFSDISITPIGTSFETPSELVPFPFQLESSSSARSSENSCTRLPSGSQPSSQLPQTFNSLPSPDVIDVTKLARQDQPPPAYESVDDRPSSNVSPSPLATRAPRPLPMPPLNSLSSSSSSHSVNPAADAAPAESHENSNLAPQSPSSPDRLNSALSTGRPFPSSVAVGTSQSPTAPLALLHPLDHSSSRDWLDRYPAGVSPLPSQGSFSTLTPLMASEPSQPLISVGSSDHDSSWTSNQSFSGSQQGTSAASVSSRPVLLSGSIQAVPPPPPYSPREVSSSRGASHPSSEYIDEMRYTHRPPPAAPVSSSRGMPPPAPPTILDPPPARSNSTRNSRAPHEPFLSDAPAPPDSWIAVETTQVEYRLVARLPGFRRDAMCVFFCLVTSGCLLTNRYYFLLKNPCCKATARVARCG